MNVNADGSLSLFVCDLNPEHREVPEASLEDFHFSSEARIAAAYANRAGYRVTFVRAGSKAVEMSKVGGRYFSPRRLKKNWWPVAFRRDSPRLASGGSK